VSVLLAGAVAVAYVVALIGVHRLHVHRMRKDDAALAISIHAYSPPLPAMTRYELTPGGLVTLSTEGSAAW